MTARKSLVLETAPSTHAPSAPMKTSVLPTLPPTSAADVAAETGDVVVTVSSPKAFRFTDDQYRVHEYAQGVYDMPAHHANHWFVKAHGVKPYVKPKVGKADAE